MKSALPIRLLVALLLNVPLAGCVTARVTNDVPHCERLVPAFLLSPVEHAPVPEVRALADGHEDAQPWQEGFLIEGGQLDKANERAPGVDHIYRECLKLHRDALARAARPKLFGLF